MEQLTESVEDELVRRHRAAATTVIACAATALLLFALAFAGVRFALPASLFDPTFAGALWIAILLCGLGAVALRRTKFSAMRLRDIAALGGPSGLLAALQSTTVLVALLGGAIAVMGFIIVMITGDKFAMLRAAPIALAVLLYCYPRRAAWRRMIEIDRTPGGDEESPAKGRIA